MKYVSGNKTRFSSVIKFKIFFYIISKKQLVIQKNIDLNIRNRVLRLSNVVYISGLIINLINIAKLWYNKIEIYFFVSQFGNFFFSQKPFVYIDNMRN